MKLRERCVTFQSNGFLPPANVVCEGYVLHLSVILLTGGACVVAPGGRGHAWFFQGGVVFLGGVVFSGGVCIVYDEIRSMSGWYASYWNAFLFFSAVDVVNLPVKTVCVPLKIVTCAQVGWLHCQWLHRPCFFNLRVSRINCENLKQQIRRDINCVTFRKYITLLIQKLKLIWLTTNHFLNLISYVFCSNDVTNFLNATLLICHFRFKIIVLTTTKFECQCSHYLNWTRLWLAVITSSLRLGRGSAWQIACKLMNLIKVYSSSKQTDF